MKIMLLALAVCTSVLANNGKLKWQGWSEDVFKQAKAEKKLVLLDLEAVWCHWCHVMEEKTYSDPKVIALLQEKYLTVRVDQDSRPDLAQRYEDYGWPATIVFDSEGRELAKRSGFIEPKAMASMLDAFAKDPTPGPSVTQEEIPSGAGGVIDDTLRKELVVAQESAYDAKLGGWGFVHKFVYPAHIEYSIRLARKNDEKAAERAKATLKLNYQLQDPAWGGVYQYSVRTWKEPHFEKILSYQTGNILAYSLAHRQWKDPKYVATADSIFDFLNGFLRDENGGFYTSQDADLVPGQHSEKFFRLGDKARRKKGIPRVDKHQYARENGWVIESLCHLFAATGEGKYLEAAKRAAQWASMNRSLGDGGFRHDEKDAAGPYLGDTLAMARAFLALYEVTADKAWLASAAGSARFIEKNFRLPSGYAAAKEVSRLIPARAQGEENWQLARFANLLHHYTGESKFREGAEHAAKFVFLPATRKRLTPSALLLLDEELRQDPTHITIVGGKTDPNAKALFTAALQHPDAYLRVEWWDKQEGNLPRNDVTYPTLTKAAAFLCTAKRCSLPIYNAPEIAMKAQAFQKN